MQRLLVIAAALVAVLAGCDNGGFPTESSQFATGSTPSIDSVGAEDGKLLQALLIHEQTTVQLAELAQSPARGASPPVQKMAQDIAASGRQDMARIGVWMEQWQVPSPRLSGSAPTEGMASQSGAAFDKVWLDAMVVVQQQAAMLAQKIQEESANQTLVDFAERLETNANTRISAMQAELLSSQSPM